MAARLGAPVVRVFARRGVPEGHTREEVTGWVVECLEECTAHGTRHGVIVVLQNHDELLKTAGEVLEIRQRISSEWFGLNVDIGSLRTGDPYEEIARLAPQAYTWQIKELVRFGSSFGSLVWRFGLGPRPVRVLESGSPPTCRGRGSRAPGFFSLGEAFVQS